VVNVKTNLIIQLEILGRWLAITVCVLGLASFFLARFRAGESWAQAFSSAVAIAVAIVPAGLPSLVRIGGVCVCVGGSKKGNWTGGAERGRRAVAAQPPAPALTPVCMYTCKPPWVQVVLCVCVTRVGRGVG
jgi:hypothetical protein